VATLLHRFFITGNELMRSEHSAKSRGLRVAAVAACLALASASAVRASAGPPKEGDAGSTASSAHHPTAAPATTAAASNDTNAKFRRGLGFYDAKNYGAAVEQWERLLAELGHERGWKLLYNLGLAYQGLRDATRAHERFGRFVATIAKRPAALTTDLEQRRIDSVKRLKAIEAEHGAVRFPVPTSGGKLLVRIDGGQSRAAGFTAFLEPGPHTFELDHGSLPTRKTQLVVVAGSSHEVDTTAPAVVASASSSSSSAIPTSTKTPPPLPPANDSSATTVVLLVGAGLTLASVGLPIALGLEAQSQRDSAEALGTEHHDYREAIADFESARTAYRVSYVAPVALGVLTAVGVTIAALLNRPDDEAPQAARVELLPLSCTATGGGLCVHGSF